MLIIGHRGCYYPGFNQNTIRAFEKVVSQGVPAIEFDVQLCADDELVIVHNLDLEQVSTGKGAVSKTDSGALKKLYAGDPSRGRDRIPFLYEVFDFFAALVPDERPEIHMELKGDNTGEKAGALLKEYVDAGKLQYTDVLASSFNWNELEKIRSVCPAIKIALLDGAIRRSQLLLKTGKEAEVYFERVFAYGGEEYMLPRYSSLDENLRLLKKECTDEPIRLFLEDEIKACLNGEYYTEQLLDEAVRLQAKSINLWYLTVGASFIVRAHERGLAVLVYTVNKPEDWKRLVDIHVDGFFTDYYRDAASFLAL